MLNKKLMILAIAIVSLLAVSVVSAADNATNVEVKTELNSINEFVNVNDYTVNDDNVTSNHGILGSCESQDNISLDNDEIDNEPLSAIYPSSSDYSVTVSDTIISDEGGYISIDIRPAKGFTYYSCYYLKVYDSSNREKISKFEAVSYYHIGSNIKVDSGQLSVGTYTIKLINYADNKVMDTAKLTVKRTYPSSSEYSVRVSGASVGYGVGGTISMSISPSSSSTFYRYYYYLKVYDYYNNEKISERFSGTTSDHSRSYNVRLDQLRAGDYTINLINYADNKVMDTAKLTVKSVYPSSSEYSVQVSDVNVIYKVGGTISMKLSSYNHCYYLKVYSSNYEKISQLFNGTASDYSRSYDVGPDQLGPGDYTIKLINYADNKVMDTFKFTVKYSSPYFSDYSVRVSSASVGYEVGGTISMSISPSSGYSYNYNYYLKVYDSSNNEKISQHYRSTASDYSKSYNIGPNHLRPGDYTIKLINYADNKVMDTAKLTVEKLGTSVSAYDTTYMRYGDKGYLYINLADSKGHALNGKSIFIILNGKTYYGITDDFGRFAFTVPKLVPKTYKASIKFVGDDDYASSFKSVNVVIKPITKVTVKNKVGYEGKKIKLTAIVKDGLGKKIKKGTVKFKIKGKTYKAKVKKGKAKITIKVPVAKEYKTVTKSSGNKRTVITYYKSIYNCKATFSGYKQYPSSTTKFKITSKYKPYSYSYYVKKKSSSSGSSKKKSTEIFEFNVPHANAKVDVRVYTGSQYNTYVTQTNWLGNGAVAITETVGTFHKVYLDVHYYDGGFKTATYDGGQILLRK